MNFWGHQSAGQRIVNIQFNFVRCFWSGPRSCRRNLIMWGNHGLYQLDHLFSHRADKRRQLPSIFLSQSYQSYNLLMKLTIFNMQYSMIICILIFLWFLHWRIA